MEADRTLVGARAVNERHWISKEEYFGRVIFLRTNFVIENESRSTTPALWTRAVGNIEGRR